MATEYSTTERLLHHAALGSNFVAQASFDLEKTLKKPVADVAGMQHVFVSGLARAGTTVLMRVFHETGKFRSLTYRDMPFVLMPGIWSGISRKFHDRGELKERAHGDNLLVSYDSPEAFDEVFWRVHCGKDYIRPDCLVPHKPDTEMVDQFRQYVGLVLSSSENPDDKRYLSKNNNNILRLGTIRSAFPEALIIIPFRSPLQHAYSLMKQHARFNDEQNHDDFTRQYMSWLGHYEFGPGHRPFCFSSATQPGSSSFEPDSFNYWLHEWCETYEYLLAQASHGECFLSYELLCDNPEQILGGLFSDAGMEEETASISIQLKASRSEIRNEIDSALKDRSDAIHAALLARTGH